jgi:hypothetical protein
MLAIKDGGVNDTDGEQADMLNRQIFKISKISKIP